MAIGKWHGSKLTCINNKNMMGFALPTLLPDTPTSIKAKGNLLHIFDAEDALEEVSEKHTNFLLNTGDATSADIEALGEEVRRRVKEKSGVELEWEIQRVGMFADGANRDAVGLAK